MINVCIIGCGMIANSAHIPAYLKNQKDYRIQAVADFSREAAKRTAEKFGIQNYYTSVAQMLETHRPDLVSVCTPNLSHLHFAKQALLAGANVLCEKPLATTYAAAKALFDLAAEKNRVVMTCQSLRFLPERLAAKALVDSGTVGKVYYAELSRIRQRGIPTWGKFHLQKESGGGAFLDIGVHAVDSAIWLMGNPRPKAVTAVMKKVHADETGAAAKSGALKGGVDCVSWNPDEMDVESFASGSVLFENGAALNFKVAWAANLKEENNIILSGEKCGVDIENKKIYFADKSKALTVAPNGFANEPFYGHFCLVKNMADVLLRGATPCIQPAETLQVTAMIEAAYLSAKKGRTVFLNELQEGGI